MRVLDLFAGKGGWSAAFRDRGHDVYRVDLAERFEVESHADVLTLTPGQLPWRPDIVLASPPCEAFSVLRIGYNWTTDHQPKTDLAREGLSLVMATRLLLERLQPRYWVVENPRGKLRKLGAVAGWERRTVTYCQLGLGYQKPTDLWGGFPPSLVLPAPCQQGDLCHAPAPRRLSPMPPGAVRGSGMVDAMVKVSSGSAARQAMTDDRAVVPYALSLRVCVAAERDLARHEAHTPECVAEWLADSKAPCSCPQPGNLVDKLGDGSLDNQPPATPTHPSGMHVLDSVSHAHGERGGRPPQARSDAATPPVSAVPAPVDMNTRPVLGNVVPCRTCHGSGVARNPERGDPELARSRNRLRRHGIELDPVPSTATCPECQGTGVRPAGAADATDPERNARRLAAAAGDLGGPLQSVPRPKEGQVVLWDE